MAKKDIHYYGTGAGLMLAGYDALTAATIARFAQFVDDLNSDGHLVLEDEQVLHWRRTAHKGMDYANLAEMRASDVWIFHFPPGRHGWATEPVGVNCYLSLIDFDIDSESRMGLAILGILAHVFFDSHAHQGFMAIAHEDNDIEDLEVLIPKQNFAEKLIPLFGSGVVETVHVPGHGAVLSLPDRVNALFKYTRRGERIVRDNRLIYRGAFADFIKANVIPGSKPMINLEMLALKSFWDGMIDAVDEADADEYLETACGSWRRGFRQGIFGDAVEFPEYTEPQPGDPDFIAFVRAAGTIKTLYKCKLIPARGLVY